MPYFSDLKDFNCRAVFVGGKKVAEDGRPLFSARGGLPRAVKNTVHVRPVSADDFTIKLTGSRARVIGIQRDTLVTRSLIEEVESRGGDVLLEGTDLLRLAVVERHFASGNIGLGLVKGYGLKGGAAATTVAHDSHNMIIIGDDRQAMAQAAEELVRIGGGHGACARRQGDVRSARHSRTYEFCPRGSTQRAPEKSCRRPRGLRA